MKKTQIVAGFAILGLSATSFGDLTFGGARAAGMGGAGLALPFDIGNNYRLNPAFLGFGSKTPTLQWPSVGYKLDGFSIANIRDVVGNINHGALDATGILNLARNYATDQKAVSFGGNAGIRLGGFAVGASGEAGINSIPNAALMTWAQNGGNVNNVDPGSRLDAYGYGYQQYEIGYGNSVRTKVGKLTVGANLRRIKSYYAHKFADQATIQNNNSNGIQNGSGLLSDFASKESTGLDVGVLYNLPKVNNLFFGGLVQNAIEPDIKFNYEAPGGANPIVPNGFAPYKRNFNFGVGYAQDRLMFAADWVDVGNNAGGQQLRYGAEFALAKNAFLRAGYNSQTAFTYGVSIGGFNIQLGGKSPLTLTSVLRF
jgi:hypothetical protein